MKSADAAFLRECLKKYYFEWFGNVEEPTDIHRREFGYRKVDSGMVRHVAVSNMGELRALLLQEAPADVYASNGRYLFPHLPMHQKEWQDADIIFDIDAKDMNLPCRPSHTVGICACGISSGGGRCPECGSTDAKSVSLPCRECIRAAEKEAYRLQDLLHDDLGMEGRVYFSGNEGFHVHVEGGIYAALESRERADLADYIMFQGITAARLGLGGDLARTTDRGWRGRFAREVFGSRTARTKMASKLKSAGKDVLEGIIGGARIGIRIDPAVSIDIHRVFRMPGSINGKSCLAKLPHRKGSNPYTRAVVLHDNMVAIRAACPAKFSLGGKRFGPYHDESVKVPAYAAAYMVCRGLAGMDSA